MAQLITHKDKLLELYSVASSTNFDAGKIDKIVLNNIVIIANNAIMQKAVFTVFITLAVHKLLDPAQDIRYHQVNLKNGFSGRTIDSKYITPTLRELNLPSMAESGWLTRSLEQPSPYTKDYKGNIKNKLVKNAFLELIDDIQVKRIDPKLIIVELLKLVIKEVEKGKIAISKIENSEKIQIHEIISMLQEHFNYDYKTRGGAKLPVIAFYAIYQIIIAEIKRYSKCSLKDLACHTASDKTSNSAGDIEILDEYGKLFKVLEIKLGKRISYDMVKIAYEKIKIHNPQRYYILSTAGLVEEEEGKIANSIREIKDKHGCQIILNGVVASLKYYLRLIESYDTFLVKYGELVQKDIELKPAHKQEWNNILTKFTVN